MCYIQFTVIALNLFSTIQQSQFLANVLDHNQLNNMLTVPFLLFHSFNGNTNKISTLFALPPACQGKYPAWPHDSNLHYYPLLLQSLYSQNQLIITLHQSKMCLISHTSVPSPRRVLLYGQAIAICLKVNNRFEKSMVVVYILAKWRNPLWKTGSKASIIYGMQNT